MSDKPDGIEKVRRGIRKKPEKTLADELMELNEELLTTGNPLDFQSYQIEVSQVTTPVWPVEDIDKVFQQIIWHCRNAIGGDKKVAIIQAAAILRHIAELADAMPMSLERIAHISLSDLPAGDNELGTNPSDTKKIN